MTEQEETSQTRTWSELIPRTLTGGIILLGAADTGKSTLARWLVERMVAGRETAAWIDGDIGQSTLGLPTTLDMVRLERPAHELPQPQKSFFVGSTNMTGNFLPVLTGLKRLQDEARESGARTLVIDTTGLVDKKAGGLALKEWKIELLRPGTVLALQRRDELEPVVTPLRQGSCVKVIDLPVASEVRPKSREQRLHNRRKKFQDYFKPAGSIHFRVGELPVYRQCLARRLSLLGFLDEQGFCLALGIILKWRETESEILTPLRETTRVAAIRVGATRVDPVTGLKV